MSPAGHSIAGSHVVSSLSAASMDENDRKGPAHLRGNGVLHKHLSGYDRSVRHLFVLGVHPEMTLIGQHDQMLELAETRQVHHRLPKRPLVPVSVRIKAPALTSRRSVNATFISSPSGTAAAAFGAAR